MNVTLELKEVVKKRLKVVWPFISILASFVRYISSKISDAKQSLLSRQYVKHLLKRSNEIYIEVGAGNKKGKNGWVTIDIKKSCDLPWDLRKWLPFPDERVSKIYSSHFLEHLSFREGQQFLNECKRVLVPGGVFSICVPNARLYIEAYFKSEPLNKDKFLGYRSAYNNTTKIDCINYTAYMDGEHKYMFDEENLIYILESKGFKNVYVRKFDSTLDMEDRDFESIYAQAEK